VIARQRKAVGRRQHREIRAALVGVFVHRSS
jgi:hypothetical protein